MNQPLLNIDSTDISLDLITKSLSNAPFLRWLVVLAAAVFVISALASPATAQDQGEEAIVGYRILDESAGGPHTIQLQVSPVTPILGISRFAVRVLDTASGEEIHDAKVSLLAAPAEEGEAQYTLALNSPVDPTFYLSQLDLETGGVWAVEVRVESELGEGTSIMSLQVSERGRSGTGNGWGQALFGLVSLSFILGITWVWWSSKKALRRREQQKRQQG